MGVVGGSGGIQSGVGVRLPIEQHNHCYAITSLCQPPHACNSSAIIKNKEENGHHQNSW